MRQSNHWRSIVEAVPQHIWTTDAAGEPTYFNPQVIAFAGTTEQEIFGAGYGSPLIHPDDQKAVRRAWRDAMENGLPFRLDHRARNGAGVDRWLELRSMPLRDDVGRITRWVGIATDVTERKVLEKEARSAKELLVRALEEGKMYLFQFELEGGRIDLARNTIVNVWSSLGFEAPPSARPFAETLAVLVLPEDQAMLAEAVRAAIAGETPAYEVEYRARHADGTIRWNLARGTVERDKDGTPVRFMGSSVDVTALKRGELELQQAKKVAENANRAKDEFLANVSHEIRTPMNPFSA